MVVAFDVSYNERRRSKNIVFFPVFFLIKCPIFSLSFINTEKLELAFARLWNCGIQVLSFSQMFHCAAKEMGLKCFSALKKKCTIQISLIDQRVEKNNSKLSNNLSEQFRVVWKSGISTSNGWIRVPSFLPFSVHPLSEVLMNSEVVKR